ncbi:uncharacterized protein LOC135483442 [Lineus longissimus]|uniref:uncharacterized protein LOC135483442 n=1 Tax=Lineus longissimus TaxID=88925 RepID=UPI00315CA78D
MYAKMGYFSGRYGTTTNLTSPVLTKVCRLEFAYYFNSDKTGSDFTVMLVKTDTRATDNIFSVTGAQGDRWNKERIDIRPYTSGGDFQVIFQAVHTSQGATNSYILDFVWTGCACSLSPCYHGSCSETLGFQCNCDPGWTASIENDWHEDTI